MATAATYAQFVLGTPGAGKSTYCAGMSEFMRLLKRKCVVVNLDPANDRLPYECAVDIRELVRLEDVMERHTPEAGDAEESFGLGPNGGLVFCIEYLERNLDWLRSALKPFESQWILFDCPGQVELYTVHTSMRNIFRAITNDWQWRTACVHLVDVAHCLDASRYISALLLSLTAMLHLELPHVNVLSKIDQLRQFGRLPLGLQFYSEVLNLQHLVMLLEQDPMTARFTALNSALCNLIEEFGLVRFVPLKIENKHSVFRLLQEVDRSVGYADDNTA